MSKNKLTVYQKLTKIFGYDNGKQVTSKSFNFNREELLKTDDPIEFEKAKLQAQQTLYVQDKWAKLETNLYNQSVYYAPNRLSAYYDYESMEQTPEISAALDIYSEESTTVSEKGDILTIYSESERVKTVLKDLFENKLDINTNLQMWARNLCKYGDNFVYLKTDPELGVIGCQQLPNLEIERWEGNQSDTGLNTQRITDLKELRFTWTNASMDFQSWEIAHFRLMGDDRKLPYGTSMLDKIRRIWKQLLLAEDAMLIYRTSRAPERRVFKVFVGNMDDKDVEAYVQRVANKFKRDVVVDRSNGNVDMRYNQMAVDQDYFIPVRDPSAPSPIDTLPGACLSLDTKIPLLDGRTLTLQDIINRWESGERNLWVYSTDPITGEALTLPITWAGVTRKNTNVLKITLDNGETVISTPDHKFVHRTKGFVDAQDLVIGDSLMPFYRKKGRLTVNKGTKKYEKVWDNKKGEWIFTHNLVKSNLEKFGLFNKSAYNEKNIYHKDQNRFNNNPENLLFINSVNHQDLTENVLQQKRIKISNVIKCYLRNNFKSETFDFKIKKKIKEKTEYFNHKIVKIELLDQKIDTGTITVDGDEIYSNAHTFALESGIFVKNSNLSEIADIEYIQKKMLAALRIPKAFLGFEEVVGDGKNLALMDIRFARTINRIQKSLIQELNKIALIHLYILGFEDDLQNFTLGLTNPSAQSDLLRLEQWKEKISLYKDATSDQSQIGILPVSHTFAKKTILGMSDSEVLLDLQQQRLERAMGAELTNTANVIRRTRVFDEVDEKYGIPEEEREKLDKQVANQADQDSLGNDFGSSSLPPEPSTDGGEEPLSEGTQKTIKKYKTRKNKNLESFDFKKAQTNIYEIENKINEILNN